MSKNQILCSKKGPVLWLTLNRPEAMNSLTQEMVNDLDAALDAIGPGGDVRTIVVAGNGQAFCAGADLKAARDRAGEDNPNSAAEFVAKVSRLIDKLEVTPVPVIVAVNGLALAGGLEIVLAADLVLASKSSRFGDAHANFGMLPGAGASIRLPRKIGLNRAKYLAFTGEFLPAAMLADWGLVNEIVPDDELHIRAQQLAQEVSEKSPLALSRMKELMNNALEQSQNAALKAEATMSQLHSYSFDHKEGLAAFAEKRKPLFRGY
jgi:enoyl-CoA hydratase